MGKNDREKWKKGVHLARSPERRGKKRGEITGVSFEPKTAASKPQTVTNLSLMT